MVQNHSKEGFTEVLANKMYDFIAGGELKPLKDYSYINPSRYPELARLHKEAEDARKAYNYFIWFRVHNYIDRIIEISAALKINKVPSNLVDEARKFVAYEDRLKVIRDDGLWEYNENGKKYWEENQEKERRHQADFERKHPDYKEKRDEAWAQLHRASGRGRVSSFIMTEINEKYGFEPYKSEKLTITELAGVYFDFIDHREKAVYEKQKSLGNLENYCRGIDKALKEIYPNKSADERVHFWYRHFKLPLTIYPDKKVKPTTVKSTPAPQNTVKEPLKPKIKVETKPQVKAEHAPQPKVQPNIQPKAETQTKPPVKTVKVEPIKQKEEQVYVWQPPKELASDFRQEKGVLKKYVGSADYVIVPDGITRMWYNAFDKAKDFIRRVVLPEGITEIPDDTFIDCVVLEKIELPSTLKKIGANAFRNCPKLWSINFPKNLEYIGIHAFEDCTALKSVTLPKACDYTPQPSYSASFPLTCSINGVIVEKKQAQAPVQKMEEKKVTKPQTKPVIKAEETLAETSQSEFVVENGVCKQYLGNAETVVIPSGVKKISLSAFAKKPSIKRVIIPDGVKEIGAYAFEECANLEKVDLPTGLKIIKNGVFSNCGKLSEITLPDSVKQIGGYAFNNCISLEKLTIPTSLEKIVSFTFNQCVNLKEVRFSSTIKELEYGAFDGCKNLKTVALPKTCTLGRFIVLGPFPETCKITEL